MCEGERFFEVAAGVAIAARNFQMQSQQRVFCFGMVELHRRAHFFPTGRGMARFASSLECAFVRIGVAIDTVGEFDSGELDGLFRTGRKMAFFASHLGVHSGQRILRF